jgi:hypothetical protein
MRQSSKSLPASSPLPGRSAAASKRELREVYSHVFVRAGCAVGQGGPRYAAQLPVDGDIAEINLTAREPAATG